MHRQVSVAIIGGGYAGLAAGVRLAESGVPVTLYEAATTLGGRARRIVYQGQTLDNGQHILLGAYSVLRALVTLVAPARVAFLHKRLRILVHRRLEVRCWPLPAPANIAFGILAASGLSWRERFQAMRFLLHIENVHPAEDASVDQWIADNAQSELLAQLLWRPLCAAALNTPAAIASARLFRATLLAAFSGKTSNSDLLFSRYDLTALFPEPAAAYMKARGGDVRSAIQVRAVEKTADGFIVITDRSRDEYPYVICATGPRQARHLLNFAELVQFDRYADQVSFEPIYTVYFKYADVPQLSFPMIGLAGGLTQWVFDRRALGFDGAQVACVISASGPHENLSRDVLVRTVIAELTQAFGWAEPIWSKLVIEKQATFSAIPGLQRPAQKTELGNFFLAGDYTAGPYPATLEAAVASGSLCASHILNSLK